MVSKIPLVTPLSSHWITLFIDLSYHLFKCHLNLDLLRPGEPGDGPPLSCMNYAVLDQDMIVIFGNKLSLGEKSQFFGQKIKI